MANSGSKYRVKTRFLKLMSRTNDVYLLHIYIFCIRHQLQKSCCGWVFLFACEACLPYSESKQTSEADAEPHSARFLELIAYTKDVDLLHIYIFSVRHKHAPEILLWLGMPICFQILPSIQWICDRANFGSRFGFAAKFLELMSHTKDVVMDQSLHLLHET